MRFFKNKRSTTYYKRVFSFLNCNTNILELFSGEAYPSFPYQRETFWHRVNTKASLLKVEGLCIEKLRNCLTFKILRYCSLTSFAFQCILPLIIIEFALIWIYNFPILYFDFYYILPLIIIEFIVIVYCL